MRNKMTDLRNHLFEAMERLKSGDMNVNEAREMSNLAKGITDSARLEFDFIKEFDLPESEFFEQGDARRIADQRPRLMDRNTG